MCTIIKHQSKLKYYYNMWSFAVNLIWKSFVWRHPCVKFHWCKQTPLDRFIRLVYHDISLRPTHTYLAQRKPWSPRRFLQGEAFPLHYGLADPCDRPKCGRLGCVIFDSGGLRSRYPLINKYKIFLCKIDIFLEIIPYFKIFKYWFEKFIN